MLGWSEEEKPLQDGQQLHRAPTVCQSAPGTLLSLSFSSHPHMETRLCPTKARFSFPFLGAQEHCISQPRL